MAYARRDGDGDVHCYRIEICNACDRRDGDGDGRCFRIEDVWHMIDVMAMVMDIVRGLKL